VLAGDLPFPDIQEVVVTDQQPELPVVEVDQAFPLLTTDGATRGGNQPAAATDQAPAVSAVIRDVLGWRPRREDTKAFTAALGASFQLYWVQGHREARYVPRGFAVQADLGGVTGGQASLYTRAQAAHGQITRLLDALKPLRPDSDPEDCEAYRTLVRDSVNQVVSELGMPGGPRVELIDSAFAVLTGQQFGRAPGAQPGTGSRETDLVAGYIHDGEIQLAPPGTTVDDIPGQLGALRDRFGLTDDNVNTVEEEQVRTSFLTLVDLVVDLQDSWSKQREAFGDDAGRGFLGTELVLINRLMAAAAEQVDELEAVLDSALVSSAERQTVLLDKRTRLTLDGLLTWMRAFLTKDGPRIARDTGRDGLTTSFTPTVLALQRALGTTLVAQLGIRSPGSGIISYLPLGCFTQLPPGMHAARTKIAVSGLCGLLERLADAAARIGRFTGAVLIDVVVTPVGDLSLPAFHQDSTAEASTFVRVEVRGLHLRPSYVPAFVAQGVDARRLRLGRLRLGEDLILPVSGSASANADSVVAIFSQELLPTALRNLDLRDGAVFAASEIPLTLVDGEVGRIVNAPPVTTWPAMRPASIPDDRPGRSTYWDTLEQNQMWVPQSTGSVRADPIDLLETGPDRDEPGDKVTDAGQPRVKQDLEGHGEGVDPDLSSTAPSESTASSADPDPEGLIGHLWNLFGRGRQSKRPDEGQTR
jgi:hypothetical protein